MKPTSPKRKRGRPRVYDEPRMGFLIRLPLDLHRQLLTHAAALGRPLNEILVEVVTKWWARQSRRARIERLTKNRE
jgi:hypothetical protein